MHSCLYMSLPSHVQCCQHRLAEASGRMSSGRIFKYHGLIPQKPTPAEAGSRSAKLLSLVLLFLFGVAFPWCSDVYKHIICVIAAAQLTSPNSFTLLPLDTKCLHCGGANVTPGCCSRVHVLWNSTGISCLATMVGEQILGPRQPTLCTCHFPVNTAHDIINNVRLVTCVLLGNHCNHCNLCHRAHTSCKFATQQHVSAAA